MDYRLAGKQALVTAATRGIGLAIARVLAREGAQVAVVARTEAEVRRVAAELGGLGIVADLTTEAGCAKAVAASGEVAILVNNLGLRAGSTWDDTGVEELETAMRGNLYAAARVSKALLPAMKHARWGRIVTIGSLFGREAGGSPAYNAAKTAEISFTTSLGREVAATGVTVNCVAPGGILFEGGSWHRRQQADPQGIDEYVRREMPLGRFGRTDEVAEVVGFLCSEAAGYVNAACWAVDGGQGRSLL